MPDALGANVVAIDIDGLTLDRAAAVGARATINARHTVAVAEAVRDLSGGGAHVSIDALGSPETCFHSIDCLRKRGRHVQVGLLLADQRHPAVPMDKIVAHELEIRGSHGMQAHRYDDMLAMIGDGRLPLERLSGKSITLVEAARGFDVDAAFGGPGITTIDFTFASAV